MSRLFKEAEAAIQAGQKVCLTPGVTQEMMMVYRELAKRRIAQYTKTGNAAGVAVQTRRLAVLNQLLK